MHFMSDQVISLPLIFDTEPIAMNNRVAGLGARNGTTTGANHVWNAHEWDLKS